MPNKILSDAQIKRRKKFQARSSQATGALGLAALGGTLMATKAGQKGIGRAYQMAGKVHPEGLKTEKLKSTVAPVLATSAGVSGVSSFNFARYTNSEARKRTPVAVAKGSNVSAFGIVHD